MSYITLKRHNQNVRATATMANSGKPEDAKPTGLRDVPPTVARLPKVVVLLRLEVSLGDASRHLKTVRLCWQLGILFARRVQR